MTPNIFVQPYVIRAPLDSPAISYAYILLPGKTEGMYTETLREVLNSCRGLGLNPTPAINAARRGMYLGSTILQVATSTSAAVCGNGLITCVI